MRERIETLIRRPRRRRSLGSYVARTLLPRTVIFGTLASALLVGNAMSVDRLAAPAGPATSSAPPTWTDDVAMAHPGCVDSADWPDGRPADSVVAYSFQGQESQRIAFDRAWALNHNATEADDLWVLGVCP